MTKIDKIKTCINKFCNILEVIIAFFIIVGLILTFVYYFLNIDMYLGMVKGNFSFAELLKKTFDLIIGIEFLQMLCKPKSDNVIEVLIFLVSRHLILEYDNSVMDFLAIIAVCILVILRRFMREVDLKEIHIGNKEKKED